MECFYKSDNECFLIIQIKSQKITVGFAKKEINLTFALFCIYFKFLFFFLSNIRRHAPFKSILGSLSDINIPVKVLAKGVSSEANAPILNKSFSVLQKTANDLESDT